MESRNLEKTRQGKTKNWCFSVENQSNDSIFPDNGILTWSTPREYSLVYIHHADVDLLLS